VLNQELLKYEGNQVAPAQLEALLNCHPDILDSAVFGLSDGKDIGNDLPAAAVVRVSPSITAEDVKRYVAENVSDFKKLRGGVFFVDRIKKVRLPTISAYD
jgi:acyl-coenzyme A synthetase/AMP-(fatty) acid ligase